MGRGHRLVATDDAESLILTLLLCLLYLTNYMGHEVIRDPASESFIPISEG